MAVSNYSQQEPSEFYAAFSKAFPKMLHTGYRHHLEVRGSSCLACSEPVEPPSCGIIDKMKKALMELFTPEGGDLQHAALRLGK